MNDSRRVDVFVSYRHREPTMSWVRETLVGAMEDAGLSVLLDVRDFVPGDLLIDGMEDAAGRARITLAVVDETYRESGFTDFEREVSPHVVSVVVADVPADRCPPADQTIDFFRTPDLSLVVNTVRSMVKRVFVLEADEDKEWVEGILLPVLEQADVGARHSGDIAPGEAWAQYVERGMFQADRVVVILSSAYLRDVDAQADKVVRHVEAAQHVKKMVPVQREAGLTLPPRFQVRGFIDASAQSTEKTVARICQALEIEPPTHGRPPSCPYPGMRPFTDLQASTFFGRDTEIAEVVAHLRRRRFAAVVGPSGSGKSSIVAAGVVPRLRDTGLDGTPAVVEIIRPGATPAVALRDALARVRDAAAASGPTAPDRVVVIDQLEEAFAVGTAGTKELFDELAAAHRDDAGLSVIVVMRADLTGAAMNQPSLWPLVAESRAEVVPLRGQALRDAIRQPAGRCGVVVEVGLAERLVAETEGEPGLLPFLQETLRALWDRLEWRLLSLEAYDRLNADDPEASGVMQAIRRESEAALAEITSRHPDGARVVRTILLRLVQFGEGAPNTRRQVEYQELAAAVADARMFEDVYQVLVSHRLLTPGSRRRSTDASTSGSMPAPAGSEPTEVAVVDLSHEAIIDGWEQLKEWLVKGRSIEVRRRQWELRAEQHKGKVGSLLSGNDLQQAEAWLAEADEDGAGVEGEIRKYISASRAQADRGRRRKQRWLVTAAALGFVLAVTFGLLAQASRHAQHAAEQETDRRVATELQASAAAYEGDITLQALLVRAADVISPSPLSALEMLATAELEPPIARRIDATDRTVGFEAASVADDYVALGDGIGGLSVWRQGETKPYASTNLGHGVLAIARQPGSTIVAVGGGNSTASGDDFIGSKGWVDLIDLADPSLTPSRITLPTDGPASALAFRGDDLFIGSWDGYVVALDASQLHAPGPLRRLDVPALGSEVAGCLVADGDRKVRSIAVDDGARWLAAGTNNCGVLVWDLATLTGPRVLAAHTDKVRAVAFVPSSPELLSTGDDGTIRSWDLAEAAPVATTVANPGRAQRAVTMCVAPDGSAVVVAGRDHRVRRWLRSPAGALRLDPTEYRTHVSTVRGVTCESPTTFASVAGDGLVLWDLSAVSRAGRTLPSADAGVVVDVDVRPGPSGEVAVASPGAVGVYEPGSSAAPRLLNLDGVAPKVLAYSSSNGRLLAVGGRSRAGEATVLLYDAGSLALIGRSVVGAGQTVSAVDVVDERHIVAGTTDGAIAMVGGPTLVTVALPTGREVDAIALGPNGDVVVGDGGGSLLCAPFARPESLASIELGRPINDLAIAGDGTVLAGTSDGALLSYPSALANPAAGRCQPKDWARASLPVLHDSILSVDAALGGSVVMAASSDGTAELWDRDRSRLLGELSIKGAADPVRHVAIDPDGSRIVMSGLSTVVELAIDRPSLRDRLCAIAGRDMTPDEQAVFLQESRYRDDARCHD